MLFQNRTAEQTWAHIHTGAHAHTCIHRKYATSNKIILLYISHIHTDTFKTVYKYIQTYVKEVIHGTNGPYFLRSYENVNEQTDTYTYVRGTDIYTKLALKDQSRNWDTLVKMEWQSDRSQISRKILL